MKVGSMRSGSLDDDWEMSIFIGFSFIASIGKKRL